MSASSSRARRAAAESVVTNGLPVPPTRMTIRPFSRWRRQRRWMYGSATVSMRMAVCRRVSIASDSSADCSARPLSTVASMPMASADGQLHPLLVKALGLAGDLERLVDADAALALQPEGLAG